MVHSRIALIRAQRTRDFFFLLQIKYFSVLYRLWEQLLDCNIVYTAEFCIVVFKSFIIFTNLAIDLPPGR